MAQDSNELPEYPWQLQYVVPTAVPERLRRLINQTRLAKRLFHQKINMTGIGLIHLLALVLAANVVDVMGLSGETCTPLVSFVLCRGNISGIRTTRKSHVIGDNTRPERRKTLASYYCTISFA